MLGRRPDEPLRPGLEGGGREDRATEEGSLGRVVSTFHCISLCFFSSFFCFAPVLFMYEL